MKVLVRKVQKEDIHNIFAIEKRVQSHPWSLKVIEETLLSSKDQSRFWCISVPPSGPYEVIGYSCFRIVLDELYIMNFAIDSAFQDMGLGSCLLKTILLYAKIKGVKRMVLDVDGRNFRAQGFYKKHGFSFATNGQNKRPRSLVMSRMLD